MEAYRVIAELETAEEIRQFLNSKGIKGFTGNGSSCPIAKYFWRETEEDLVDVEVEEFVFLVFDGYEESFACTEAMAEFIRLFDEGKFPELIMS